MTPLSLSEEAGVVRHTPGPWRAVKATHGPIDIFDSRDRDVVTVYGGGVGGEFQTANARLIAAAPDLLAVVKAQEAWEADVILNADWSGDLPTLKQEQWDRLIELQSMRNAALSKSSPISREG